MVEENFMEKRKKIKFSFLAILLVSVFFCGCSKNGKCESCGQIEKLNKYVNDHDIEYWYCDDCYSMQKMFGF